MEPEVGVITEQGDLGLGYTALNDEDQQAVNESQQLEENNN